jgi:murein DD-endopeptidase MepM/ murein hydrolase activator NlpD
MYEEYDYDEPGQDYVLPWPWLIATGALLLFFISQSSTRPTLPTMGDWERFREGLGGTIVIHDVTDKDNGDDTVVIGNNTTPRGSPVASAFRVTQGYGIGSHAPADTWGGVDLAVPGNAEATFNQPVVAVMDGVAYTTNSWPCGNGVAIVNEHYRVLHCHLDRVDVANGERVTRGTRIGAVGYSGDVRPAGPSGAHLHFEIWRDEQNVDPLPYLGVEQ